MLITAWVGMGLAPHEGTMLDLLLKMSWGTIGIALTAAAAAAVNQLWDRHLDGRMQRTSLRPLVVGRLSVLQALIFSTLLLLLGTTVLYRTVNALTASLSLLTFLGYAFLYTVYLKRRTSQNIVIGGLFGAMPPLLGWTAITEECSAFPLLLVLIIFLWTPPHFWALAIHRFEDYRDADIPMLPITHGISFTKLSMLLYGALLWMTTLFPWVLGYQGWIYLLGTTVLNGFFNYELWKLYLQKSCEPFALSDPTSRLARTIFMHSIHYLWLLFTLMVADKYLVKV